MNDELVDDAPKPPEKRYSTKYPGLVQLTWEDSERLVRRAEQAAGNPRYDCFTKEGAESPMQKRARSIGVYKRPRKPGWIHGVQARQARHGADWGIVLGLAVLLGGAVLLLAFLGAM